MTECKHFLNINSLFFTDQVMDAVKTEYRLPAPMDCPLILHTLMMDCWKKERNQRPKFAELVNALDRLMREPSQLNRKANNEYVYLITKRK